MWWVFPTIWEADRVTGYAGVLAHQGGWDEALMVIVPIGLFGGLLWASIRRDNRARGSAPEPRDPSGSDPGTDTTGPPPERP